MNRMVCIGRRSVVARWGLGRTVMGGALLVALLAGGRWPLAAAADSVSDWVAEDGFSVSLDTTGFDFPSAIAVVPNPGSDSKSPVYFVTELRGKVKVVTRDRSVHTFAEDFFTLVPPKELPDPYGEMGMAGIALDPVRGYVFVSFVYQDKDRILRNSMVRFESQPGVFGLRAGRATSFDKVFAGGVATTHQIGPMVVDGETLFVAVGDGFQPFHSQSVESILGKILRMTVDGGPVADNPFYENQEQSKPENYIWAMGLRNTFGLAVVGGRLFASDNGLNVDRFLEITRGANYRWDGTDWSTGANAPMVFGPSVGPVQVSWLPAESGLFPSAYRSRFYMALSGGKAQAGGVVTLDYDFEKLRLVSRPRQFLRYVGNDGLITVGAAFGADGLYVAMLNHSGLVNGVKGSVFRVTHDPARSGGPLLGQVESVPSIMLRLACVHCHGERKGEVIIGPSLDEETLVPRILERLKAPDYRASVTEIDRLTEQPFAGYREARRAVLEASGIEQARLWIKFRLMEPLFDRKTSAMPSLGLSEREAERIADYLVGRYLGDPSLKGRLARVIGRVVPRNPGRRHVVFAFGFGGAAMAGLGLLGVGLSRMFHRRRRAN